MMMNMFLKSMSKQEEGSLGAHHMLFEALLSEDANEFNEKLDKIEEKNNKESKTKKISPEIIKSMKKFYALYGKRLENYPPELRDALDKGDYMLALELVHRLNLEALEMRDLKEKELSKMATLAPVSKPVKPDEEESVLQVQEENNPEAVLKP